MRRRRRALARSNRAVYLSRMRAILGSALVLTLAGCMDAKDVDNLRKTIEGGSGPRPDELPVVVTRPLPFRYPPELQASRVQGNVTLRIHIDSAGRVAPESTQVVQSSGYTMLDSAAVEGSRELQFIPAKKGGEAMAISIQFPVYFRHPGAAPLPGDTILNRAARRPAP